MNNYVNEMRNIGLEIDQFFENENDDFICKSDCPRCEGKEMLICTKCEGMSGNGFDLSCDQCSMTGIINCPECVNGL